MAKVELTARKESEDIAFSVVYLPPELLAIREAGVEHPSKIGAALGEYEGLEYFRFRIEKTDQQGDVLQFEADGVEEYYRRVEYYSFEMQQDLQLVTGTDTLPCLLFHSERNYMAIA